MFNAKEPAKRRGASVRDNAVTILTSGCQFSGKLFCRGSSRIGGQIDGEIVSEGLLIVEVEAKINAQIQADEVIIQGTVVGSLKADSRVELAASSHFEGDIETPCLVINEGAQFNGRAHMAKAQEPAKIKAMPKEPEKVKPAANGKKDVPVIKAEVRN